MAQLNTKQRKNKTGRGGAHSTAAKKGHQHGRRRQWGRPIMDRTKLIVLCCCLFLFAYIHEQQKMTKLITVLSSTNTAAAAVAGLEMPNLLQTQESEEAKDSFLVQRQKGDATPLNPNKRLAILGEPRVPIDISGTKIWVHDPKECFWISKKILERGSWEPYAQSALMNSVGVKRNDDNSPSLFVDIGANIGAYSIIMAAAGYNVEAFEPMEYNVEIFAQSILENEFQDKIKLHKVAVGKASVKKVCLQVKASTKQRPNLGNNQITDKATDLGNNCVPLVRLDTIVPRCPDLVKVDVEGLEVNALIGLGVSKYGSCRPNAIAIEDWSGGKSIPYLQKLGYNCEKLSHQDFVCRIK